VTAAGVTPDDLGAVLAGHLGNGVLVDGLRRMTGGASRETWSFDAVHPDGRREGLVLRRDPGGGLQGIGRDVEERLLRAAGEGGVPVPAVRFGLAEEDGLGAGFVMERVEGETIPRRILRDPPPAMAARCGEIAARIHALPVEGLPPLPDHPGRAQVEQYRDLLDAFGEPHPAFELGLRWLEERVPPSTGTALVHGDFRNGNFVVGPEGIRADLDWELAHLGDPMEDLGWLCVKAWRFRNDDLPVGGFGKREELFAAYEAASGRPVDPEVVRWWEVLGTLKWGEMCIVQAFTHLSGAHRSVELAAIGRRVCEQEHDLLAMIS
jgi:aminoglycoside phosphotransferase (APT) family kinase protein